MSSNNGELNRMLSEELEALRLHEASLEARRKGIVAELEGIRRRQDLIKALLGVSDGGATTPETERNVLPLTVPNTRQRGNGRNVADIAYEIPEDEVAAGSERTMCALKLVWRSCNAARSRSK